MVRTTEVIADATSPVVVKRASGEGAAALQAEAERLRAAAHPGVVELLGSAGTEDSWELRLAHGGRSLDVVGVLPAEQVAAVVAAVAATLADLHDAGFVHGRLDRSHVLLGRHGRPVVCGLGADPTPATPADDVAALGTLLGDLLGVGAEMEPIPEHRWWPRRRWSGWLRRSLLLLADQACADPPTRRPTARRLAAAIAETVPDAGLPAAWPAAGADLVVPAPSSPAEEHDPIEALRAASMRATAGRSPRRPPARLPALVGALAGVLVLGAGALQVVRPAVDPVAQVPVGAVAEAPTPTPLPTPTSTSGLPPTTTIASPPPPCVRAETDTVAGGCVEPVRVDGTTVLVGDRLFQVGQPGDIVVLGDWDCDGGATPAVLRPATGEVFVFSRWAAAEDVVVPAVDQISGARTLFAEAEEDGCVALVARGADGGRVLVRAGAA